MSRKTNANTPTDEEIMSYTNVPADVAAKYIGWSSCNVMYALQQERAPYGHAVQTGVNQETGQPSYSYNITPGLLVAYKRGSLEAWKLGQLTKVLSAEFGNMIDEKLGQIVAGFFLDAASKRTA